jgi:hypothetical protein
MSSVAPDVPIAPDALRRRERAGAWWQPRWAVVPVGLIALAFVAFALPPYLTLDPAQSRIPLAGSARAYYPALVAHTVFGSVAMLTSCLQMWPWLRRRHRRAHQRIGRVYVFGGVVPAGLMGLTIGGMSPYGPVLRASNVLLAMVWLGVTLTGFRMAQRNRMDAHRRWMIRSFALTMSVITNRMWSVIWFLTLSPQVATTFGGSETLMIQAVAGLSGWLGWVLPLLVAELWLERGTYRRPAASMAARGTSHVAST